MTNTHLPKCEVMVATYAQELSTSHVENLLHRDDWCNQEVELQAPVPPLSLTQQDQLIILTQHVEMLVITVQELQHQQ